MANNGTIAQHVAGFGNSGTNPVLTLSATVLHNLLIAVINMTVTSGDSTSVQTLVDSGGQTWVKATNDNPIGQRTSVEIWYKENTAAGITSVTVTPVLACATFVQVYEIHNVPTSGTLDKVSPGHGVSTAPSSGTTATTTKNEEFVVATLGYSSGTATLSGITSGFTNETLQTSTTPAARQQVGYQFVTAAATFVYAATLSASVGWATAVATFKCLATLSPTLTDTIAAPTDTLVKVSGFSRTWSDTVSAMSDTLTKISSFLRPWTDNVPAMSDTLVKGAQNFVRSLTDTIPGPTDTFGKVVSLIRSWTDSLSSLSDTLTRGVLHFNRTWSDTVPAPSDTLTKISSFRRTLTDTIASWTDTFMATVVVRFGRAPKAVTNEYATVNAVVTEYPSVTAKVDEFTL